MSPNSAADLKRGEWRETDQCKRNIGHFDAIAAKADTGEALMGAPENSVIRTTN